MWRFIMVTFGFLAFAFWELSGGADYQPRDNSIQARANQPAEVRVTTLADAQIQASAQTPTEPRNDPDTGTERFEITLASVSDTGSARDTARTERVEDKARFLTQPEEDTQSSEDTAVLAALDQSTDAALPKDRNWPGAIALFEQQASQAQLRRQAEAAARSAMDIRYVTANSANMRGGPGTDYQRVGRLTEGAEVAVIDAPGNGWLELQVVSTGETGWMADWLISAPAQ